MVEAPKNRRNLAVIGGGVGIAAAGVMTLLVLHKPASDEPTELSARAAAIPSFPNRPLEGGVVKPWEARQPTATERAELAKADAAERDEAKAEQRQAEAALEQAKAKSARDQALEQARQYGIIGSTALQQGGAFASLTGTGDISSGFDDANIYGGLIGTDVGSISGGGTGWGTIDMGRYGSIRGSTGSGYGRVGGRTAVPTVRIGQPNVTGDLDKAIIRRYIKRNIQKIQYCYEKELLSKPQLKGTVTATFTINTTGMVDNATATGVDATVASCVAGVIKGIEFPRPKGGSVNVTYPFTFLPAGSP